MLLASLPDLRRAEVLSAMPAEDRAVLVAVMSGDMRAATAHCLGRGQWLSTMRAVKERPPLGARMLGGMEHQEVGG